jgi:membrane protease YdiL (CAAX protease family)
MRGLLKGKSAGTQFLILISIALGSFFLLGLAGTLIVAQVTGMDLMEMSDSSKWDYNDPALKTVIRGMQTVQFVCLFVIPTFLCSRLFSTDSKQYLGLKPPPTAGYYIAGVALLLLAIPLTNFLGELNQQVKFPPDMVQWMKEQEEEAAKSFKVLLLKQSEMDLVLNIFFIAGFAAVGEELLFRGIAQRLLIKLFKNAWIGIIVSAFLFSAMHMQFYGFLPRFALGILLGVLYWYSGSLWTAILAHFVYDAFLITLVYLDPSSLDKDNTLQLSNLAMAATISLVLVIVLVIWMKKRSKITYQQVYAEDVTKNHPFDFDENTPT